jgi:protein tyrosine phosphatase (PTP) superfamily phosphohydrolase (DUF442 family)
VTVVPAHRGPAPGPAGIPNFAWVDGRWLARGRQPPLTHPAYQELRDHGFSAVLSLRPEREYPDDEWRSYDAADERALCDSIGLTFRHVSCADFQAPHPSEVVKALSIIHDEIEQGRAVYLHCFAGIGRTGVVSGAWQMLRGAGGTEALREFASFCAEGWNRAVARRLGQLVPEPTGQAHRGGDPAAVARSSEDFYLAIGAHHQLWVLQTIAKALGLSTDPPAGFPRPKRPANGRSWQRRFRGQAQRHLGEARGMSLNGTHGGRR